MPTLSLVSTDPIWTPVVDLASNVISPIDEIAANFRAVREGGRIVIFSGAGHPDRYNCSKVRQALFDAVTCRRAAVRILVGPILVTKGNKNALEDLFTEPRQRQPRSGSVDLRVRVCRGASAHFHVTETENDEYRIYAEDTHLPLAPDEHRRKLRVGGFDDSGLSNLAQTLLAYFDEKFESSTPYDEARKFKLPKSKYLALAKAAEVRYDSISFMSVDELKKLLDNISGTSPMRQIGTVAELSPSDAAGNLVAE